MGKIRWGHWLLVAEDLWNHLCVDTFHKRILQGLSNFLTAWGLILKIYIYIYIRFTAHIQTVFTKSFYRYFIIKKTKWVHFFTVDATAPKSHLLKDISFYNLPFLCSVFFCYIINIADCFAIHIPQYNYKTW